MNRIIACNWSINSEENNTQQLWKMLNSIPLDGKGSLRIGEFEDVCLGERDDLGFDKDNQTLQVPVSFDGHIDNQDVLISKLALRGIDLPRFVEPNILIWHLYKAYGNRFINLLEGEFSFIIWDKQRSRIFAGTDLFAVRPLVYYIGESFLLIATDVVQLLIDDRVPFHINREKLLAFLSPASWYNEKEVLPSSTYFSNIKRLPANSHVTFTFKNGKFSEEVKTYWSPPSKEIVYKSNSDYIEHFLDEFHKSVYSRLRGNKPTVIPLSGGLDSSAIASVAVNELGASASERIIFHSIIEDDDRFQECNDFSYVSELSKILGIKGHVAITNRTRLNEFGIDPLLKCDGPDFRNYPLTFDLLNALCIKESNHLPQAIISGFGGDEATGGSPFIYDSLFLRGKWKEMYQRLKVISEGSTKVLLKLLMQRVVTPLLPYNSREFNKIFYPNNYDDSFLTEDGHNGVQEIWEDFKNTHYEGKPMYRLWGRRLMYLDISPVCRIISTRDRRNQWYPFLDKKVVEFCLSIPPEIHYNATNYSTDTYTGSKQLLRKSMTGILPSVVRRRATKTFYNGSSLGNIHDNLLRYMEEYITDDCQIGKYKLVVPSILREAIKNEYHTITKSNELTESYGFLIQVIKLEIWLREVELGREGFLKRAGVDLSAKEPVTHNLSSWMERELDKVSIIDL